MDSIILILISTCIFLPYMIYQHRKKNKSNGNIIKLYQVEAGPTRQFFKQRIDLTHMIDVDMGGIKINPELRYFIVVNQCMQVKGISDGDIIGVRMLESGYDLLASSQQRRMLLIYLDDAHFKGFKIREEGEITNDGASFNTYHYKGGVQNKSSRPHAITSIKGVVEEVYQRNYIGSMN